MFLCQATVTLHQRHGHRNEHDLIYVHAYVYRHAKFEWYSLTIVLNIYYETTILSKNMSRVRRSCDLQ